MVIRNDLIKPYADPLIWHKWLPYVLMAYRMRTHTVTKYSPFQLMFGRTMNKFENWKDLASQDETNSLVVRSTQIQQMVDIFQSQALENIINH